MLDNVVTCSFDMPPLQGLRDKMPFTQGLRPVLIYAAPVGGSGTLVIFSHG